jgi:hypothetical protein
MHDSSTCPICSGLPSPDSFSDDEFFAFLDTCRKELDAKQAEFNALLAAETQWHYDLNTGRFSVGECVFPITAIGTHNENLQTWLWAWANDAFPPAAREASSAIRSLYNLTGFKVFDVPGINASSLDAQDFTAFAIHTLEAIGFYRCPDEATLYLAVHKP